MRITIYKSINFTFLLMLWLLLPNAKVFAGFLDLPDITESPELERRTLLKDMDIPSVRNRDPDPEAGDRLSVTEFRLQGIVEFPELGITLEELNRRVESIRFDMMAEDKLLESGYTAEEIAAISDLLAEIEHETKGRHVGSLEVQRLVWLIRDQLSKRGITLGMIEIVADTITNYYRERGFILAKAYIPKQQVRDGVVSLTLLLGMLGEVEVNQNRIYKDRTLTRVFDEILAEPVTAKRIEERLFLINDFPGISVNGFFEPGTQIGDSRLNINAINEDRLAFNVRVDNHGSDQTGENRLYGEVLWNNPAGVADQLQLGVLQTANPDNATFGQLRYSNRVIGPRFTLSFGAANNDFILGQGNSEDVDQLGLQGETNAIDLSLVYALRRSRKTNHSLGLIFENIDSTLESQTLTGIDLQLGDEIRNISLAYNFDLLNEKSRMLHAGGAQFTSGKFLSGEQFGQDKNYSILTANYTLLTFAKLPFSDINTRIIAKTELQLTDFALSSISQFSLARPSRARGFEVTEFSADSALYAGVDWIFNLPKFIDFSFGGSSIRDFLQPFIFADIAYGESRALLEGDDDVTATLSNIGLGLQFDYRGKYKGNLQFAWPLENDISVEVGDTSDDDLRAILEFQYSF